MRYKTEPVPGNSLLLLVDIVDTSPCHPNKRVVAGAVEPENARMIVAALNAAIEWNSNLSHVEKVLSKEMHAH